jgi:hypothetical protein
MIVLPPFDFFIWRNVWPGDALDEFTSLFGSLSTGISVRISMEQLAPASGMLAKQFRYF